jgi:hypothetical protein
VAIQVPASSLFPSFVPSIHRSVFFPPRFVIIIHRKVCFRLKQCDICRFCRLSAVSDTVLCRGKILVLVT